MRKRILLLLAVVLCVSLCACGGNKIENLIEDIAALEGKEITLADEELIDKIYDKYFALTEEEKTQITNYDILEEAGTRVNFLSEQQSTMQNAPIIVEEYIKSCLKTPSAMQVVKTEVYASKDDCFGAFVRMQYTGENAFGGKIEETCFAQVEALGMSYNRVIKSHFGDAHETWEDLGWANDIMERIDFENKYIPTK